MLWTKLHDWNPSLLQERIKSMLGQNDDFFTSHQDPYGCLRSLDRILRYNFLGNVKRITESFLEKTIQPEEFL